MEQFMNLLLNTVKIIRILCQLFAIFFFDQLNFAPIIFQFFLIPFRIFKTNKQKNRCGMDGSSKRLISRIFHHGVITISLQKLKI